MKIFLSILLGAIILGLVFYLLFFQIRIAMLIMMCIAFFGTSYIIGGMIFDLIFDFRK
jgi:hypothetical protein